VSAESAGGYQVAVDALLDGQFTPAVIRWAGSPTVQARAVYHWREGAPPGCGPARSGIDSPEGCTLHPDLKESSWPPLIRLI
jgi:hypothetical protein